MKVAVVEWSPRICGATDWALHVAAGFRALGHDVETTTFSKSGRRLKAWGAAGDPWRVRRVADAVDYLDSRDLVVLSDIVCRSRALKADRESGSPWYLDVLSKTQTRWTTMIHDGSYPASCDAEISEALATRSFSGVLITTRLPEARRRIEAAAGTLFGPKIEWISEPYLPYDPSRVAPVPARTRRYLLMTSRLTSNKGQDALLYLFGDLAGDVSIRGFNSFGLPSYAWHLWELGCALGYDQIEPPRLPRGKEGLTHPRATRFYTGPFAFGKNGRRYEYAGDYDATADVPWGDAAAHVSLTNDGLRGTLEYSTLDAVHAGVPVVVPDHAVEYAPAYKSLGRLPFTRWSASVGNGGAVRESGAWDRPAILTVLNSVLAASTPELDGLAAIQRRGPIRPPDSKC